MEVQNVIEVKDVHKYFKIYYDKGKMLRERITSINRSKYEKREVLKGISFNVKKGEAVALIGKNGCGKSTTLKLLTRILRPNSGTINIHGRVCSLIELGAGFHPDMSGRENIYINASIFGIKAKEVDRRLNDIIRFSELEEFIDNPVRTYSSGMYMRLAFSVAISVDADILLIDEILAVGDQAFQTKCFNRLKELKKNGTTIVLVSHSMAQVEQICDKAIWIDNGYIKEVGKANNVCKHYLDDTERARAERAEYERQVENQNSDEEKKKKAQDNQKKKNDSCKKVTTQCSPDALRTGIGQLEIQKVDLCNIKSEIQQDFQLNEGFKIPIVIKNHDMEKDVFLIVRIRRLVDGVICYASRNKILFKRDELKHIVFSIERSMLMPHRYCIDIEVRDYNDERYDALLGLINFSVNDDKIWQSGVTYMDCEWKMVD